MRWNYFCRSIFTFNTSVFSGDLSAGIHQALVRHLSSSCQAVPAQIVRRPPQGKVEVLFGRSLDNFRPRDPLQCTKKCYRGVSGGSLDDFYRDNIAEPHSTVVMQLSGNHQAVIRQSSEVIRQSSGSRQAVVRQLSGSRQAVVCKPLGRLM